jgi:hypothetical protein
MRIRSVLAAFLLFASLSSIALAERPDGVSDEVDFAFWCGAVFTILGQAAEGEQKDAWTELSSAMFLRGAYALINDGIEEVEDEAGRLGGLYAGEAYDPVINGVGEERYPRSECIAAAKEEVRTAD